MIYNFIKLFLGTSLGIFASFINVKAIINFHNILNIGMGISVGVFTLIFLYYQIIKIKLDIKIKKKKLKQ